ncbi:MAG: hypothetical protein JST72_13480 [Bacteroidetes bacterium]|nr:hypothetical protein [Bacteroidota bacterium]
MGYKGDEIIKKDDFFIAAKASRHEAAQRKYPGVPLWPYFKKSLKKMIHRFLNLFSFVHWYNQFLAG